MKANPLLAGSYLPSETVLHRVDPRLKLIALAASASAVLMVDGWPLALYGFMLLALLITFRLPVSSLLRSLNVVWAILLLTFLLQALLSPGRILWSVSVFRVTDTGLANGVLYSGRVALLSVLICALTATTPPLRLADALESILGPMEGIGVPVRRLATTISIALLFVPRMISQGSRLVSTQAARGADFESMNLFRRARNLVPVLVPLFVRVFNDADSLALAMTSRGYDTNVKRGKLNPLVIGKTEAAATVLFTTLSIAVIVLA